MLVDNTLVSPQHCDSYLFDSERKSPIMAIYHFTAKIVSRRDGRSAIAAAAYRAGQRIKEHQTGITHDFTRKQGVVHSEILTPDSAPDWARNRPELWNAVEEAEKRKDAQLARDVEIALPIELDPNAQVTLLRDFVQHHFVAKGMIADLAIHHDNPNNPHAHLLLTLRNIEKGGFGLKERSWNSRASLQAWRKGWADTANEHLARAGLTVRIDHRTLKAQQLDLIPGRKIGVGLERQRLPDLPLRIAERVTEQDHIAHANGTHIIANPQVAIKALTHYQGTFTEHDIAKFLHTRTHGTEQFRDAYLKVTTSPELVIFDRDDHGRSRYISREMLQLKRPLQHPAQSIAVRDAALSALFTPWNRDADHDRPEKPPAHAQRVTAPARSWLNPTAMPAKQPKLSAHASMADIDALQQKAAERWRDNQLQRAPSPPAAPTVTLEQGPEPQPDSRGPKNADPQHQREHTYKGPEHELEP